MHCLKRHLIGLVILSSLAVVPVTVESASNEMPKLNEKHSDEIAYRARYRGGYGRRANYGYRYAPRYGYRSYYYPSYYGGYNYYPRSRYYPGYYNSYPYYYRGGGGVRFHIGF